MDEHDFRAFVSRTLAALFEQIEEIESDDVDPTIADGVLSCDFESGGTFVLSQQVPVRELWLSANLRAWHFTWNGARWVERDGGQAMVEVLGQLFSRKLGMPVGFEDPS